MNYDHQPVGGGRIAIVVHDNVVAALDSLAAVEGVTRSCVARRMIAERLQAAGLLPNRAPLTPQAGKPRRARTEGRTL